MYVENENLIVCGFNCNEWSIYRLLSHLSMNIYHSFKLQKKISKSSTEVVDDLMDGYAVFRSDLDYFNSKVYLIKNFIWKQKSQGSLFNDTYDAGYLFRTRPNKMYILMIYSDEIKTMDDVKKFIKYDTLPLQQFSVFNTQKLYVHLNQMVKSQSE